MHANGSHGRNTGSTQVANRFKLGIPLGYIRRERDAH